MNTSPAGAPEFGRRATPPTPGAEQPATVSSNSAPAQAQAANDSTPAATVGRRSKRSRSQTVVFLNFLMSIIVFAALAAGAFLYFAKSGFEQAGPSTEDTTFTVAQGAGLGAISADLETRGLVSSGRIFSMGVRANGAGTALKPGEYAIKAGSSMRQIMDVLKSGKSIMLSLTIPEGLTVDQALARIAAAPDLSGEMPPTIPTEGSMAADTVKFSRGWPRVKIVEKMVSDQKALVEKIWATRQEGLPVKDINEFVTLASIVEKETGIAAERPMVASVFVNRLNKGMRLQSDPTIIYGIFGGKGKPSDRPIYASDLKKETPYNTYVIDGLPPTPIANPGRAALEAVAHPQVSDALYFVADGTGGHVFASTLDEHNKNVAKWRAVEKQQKQDAEAAKQSQQ